VRDPGAQVSAMLSLAAEETATTLVAPWLIALLR